MTRNNVALVVMVILTTCALVNAQAGQRSQTESSVRDAQANSSQSESANLSFQQRDQRYRLRKSDVVEIKFKLSPEFDQTVTVQPDGFISLDDLQDFANTISDEPSDENTYQLISLKQVSRFI